MLNLILTKLINFFYNKKSETTILIEEKIQNINKRQGEMRKLIEKMEREEDNLLHDYFFAKTIINVTPDNFYIYDLELKKNIWSNNKIYNMLGYTPTDLQLRGATLIKDLFHEDDYYNYTNAILPKYQTMKDGEILEYDVRILHENGRYAWIHLRECVFSRNEDGSVRQIFGSAYDITEEMAYKETMKLQTAALNSAVNSIVITDSNGNIVFVNKAFCDNMGYDIEEVIGKNPRILKSNIHDADFYKQMWDTIISGKIWSGDIINKKKSGELVTDHTTITPIANGKINYFIAIKERL